MMGCAHLIGSSTWSRIVSVVGCVLLAAGSRVSLAMADNTELKMDSSEHPAP
jgi:hypothetical protein